MARLPLIAANWKMYKTVNEAVVFAKEFRLAVKDVVNVEKRGFTESIPPLPPFPPSTGQPPMPCPVQDGLYSMT